MDLATVVIISVLLLSYALVSGRLEGTVLTAPLAAAYGRLAERMGEYEEGKAVSDMPLREEVTTNNNPEP